MIDALAHRPGQDFLLLPATAEKFWALYGTKPFALIVGSSPDGLMALANLRARFRGSVKSIWQER